MLIVHTSVMENENVVLVHPVLYNIIVINT